MISSNQCVAGKILNKTQTSTEKAWPTAYSIASANKGILQRIVQQYLWRRCGYPIRSCDFKDPSNCWALKHMNPCGIGQADDIETAWDYAYIWSIDFRWDCGSQPWGRCRDSSKCTVSSWNHHCAVFIQTKFSEILTTKKKTCGFWCYLTLKMLVWSGSRIHWCCWWSLVQNQDVVKESPADWQGLPNANQLRQKRQLWVCLESYQVCEIKWYYRDQRPHTLGWPRSNQPCGFNYKADQAKDRSMVLFLLQMPSSHLW